MESSGERSNEDRGFWKSLSCGLTDAKSEKKKKKRENKVYKENHFWKTTVVWVLQWTVNYTRPRESSQKFIVSFIGKRATSQ